MQMALPASYAVIEEEMMYLEGSILVKVLVGI